MPKAVPLASSVASALAALGWLTRRRPSAAVAPATPPSPDVRDKQPGGTGGTAFVPDEAVAPSPDDVLRRLHALDFDEGDSGPIAPAHADVAAAVRAVLAAIESQPHYLPRRPLVLPQLLRSVNDPEGSARAVAAIVERDPALAAHLLRVANSAYYRVQPRPVASLERAVAMVGTDGLRRIVAAALMQPVADAGGGAFARASATAWDHALLAGEAAAERARCAGRQDPFGAHLLGLLQGLAAVVVLQVLRDEYRRRPSLTPHAATVVALLESETAAVAGRIAAKWALADDLRAALQAPLPPWEPAGAQALPHALHAGRVAAALVLLHRHGRIGADAARACLALAMPAHEATRLWGRLLRERSGEG